MEEEGGDSGDGVWTMAPLTARHCRLTPGEVPLRFQGAVCGVPLQTASALGWVPFCGESLLTCPPCLLSYGMELNQNPSSDLSKRLVVVHVLRRFEPHPPD